MAQHELLISNKVLNQTETVYRVGLNPQTLRTYNLNIDNALVNIEKAKQDVLDTEIYAPFNGVVVDVPIKINDRFSAFDYASKTAVLLVDTGTIRITGTVDELDIPKVRVKQLATIYVDAFPGKKLAGHVTFLSPFASMNKGVVQFPVEIYLEPGEDYSFLRSGLTATAEITTELRENVLYIPNGAVKGFPGNCYVEVVDPSTSKIIKRPISIGLQNNHFTEVVSGLKEGEPILREVVQ
jgi:multidrug efflux pump subunit AcrA (membrane-fusion protein)